MAKHILNNLVYLHQNEICFCEMGSKAFKNMKK